MVDLHNRLSHQHPGLRTYVTFQNKVNELAQRDSEHRAIYKLLCTIVDPFVESFDEGPLPSALAESTFHRLLGIVREAEDSIALAPDQQIDTLNRIASVELV
jgi:hypothetical protein